MTNKTNEATVKDGLPIANALLRLKEEFDSVGTKFNGLTWQGIEKAMQSYSDQQNAELAKRCERYKKFLELIASGNYDDYASNIAKQALNK